VEKEPTDPDVPPEEIPETQPEDNPDQEQTEITE
jgi:hypothetical protein